MECNVGRTEQLARLAAGALGAGLALSADQPWVRTLGGVIAAAGLITGATRYCPINQAFGFNSCAADERPATLGRGPAPGPAANPTEAGAARAVAATPAFSPSDEAMGRPELRD